MQGENTVKLRGRITLPDVKTVGQNNSTLFKAKLVIPVDEDENQKHSVKIAAWNTVAEGLGDLKEGTFVKILGHIEERSYDGKCRHCNGYDKKYWTEVLVDNFIVEEE